MRWLRRRSRSVAWVALFALLLQLALCFNHFHSGHADEAGATQQALALPADQLTAPQRGDTPDPADHSDRYCVICASLNLLGAAQIASPPLVPLPITLRTAAPWPSITATLFVPQRLAFQTRAPPLA